MLSAHLEIGFVFPWAAGYHPRVGKGMKKVLVTGATGFIGRHLVHALLGAEDVQVKIMTRGGYPFPDSWVGAAEVRIVDLTDRRSLRSALQGTDIVYHLAGETREAALFHKVNVEGTRNLLEACAGQALSRFLYLSSAGVIGPGGGNIVDEEAACDQADEYERSKFLAEETVTRFADENGMPVTILRPTVVFGEGPRRGKDSFGQWLRAIQSGRFWPIGRGSYVANYIYVKDLVQGCVLAANSEKAVGETYILSDPCPLKEFIAMMAGALGKKIPRFFIPVPLAYLAAAGSEIVGTLLGMSFPLTLNRVRALTSRRLYSSRKIRQELGFTPKIGLADGIRRTVVWYVDNGLLLPCK